MFEEGELRRIFGPKRDEITRERKKLHNEELLVGKPEGKRPLGRLRRRREDIIKLDLQIVGCGGMDWI